jgi:hypothetical protein
MFQNIMCDEFEIFVIAIEITDNAFKGSEASHQIPTDPDPGCKKVKVRIRIVIWNLAGKTGANLHSLSEFHRR